MNIFLVILVILVIIWLLLPNPTEPLPASDPMERTRTFSSNTLSTAEGANEAAETLAIPPEDIAPNPILEAYMNNELREGAYQFEVTYPNNEGQLNEQADGTHLFRLAGRVFVEKEKQLEGEEEEETELDMLFRVQFFSNDPEAYENFQPIFTEDLTFQVEGDHYAFQLSHPEELNPGLYYYLIEASESGEVYLVGKVIVR